MFSDDFMSCLTNPVPSELDVVEELKNLSEKMEETQRQVNEAAAKQRRIESRRFILTTVLAILTLTCSVVAAVAAILPLI